ncbi:MAG: hypothetical protein WBX18_16550 [Terracidiphilus sp.]
MRLPGDALLVDIDKSTILKYQTDRLKESAAPKSINEEVRLLLTLIGEAGDVIRVRLRKKKKLKFPSRRNIGKAYEPEGTQLPIDSQHLVGVVLYIESQYCQHRRQHAYPDSRDEFVHPAAAGDAEAGYDARIAGGAPRAGGSFARSRHPSGRVFQPGAGDRDPL